MLTDVAQRSAHPREQASRTEGIGIPCSLPIGAAPSSIYREYAPLPVLRSHLVCVWTLEIGRSSRPHRQRVLPDGCADIIWIGETPPIVVGPMTRPVLTTSKAGTTLVGLRLRPGTAARVFGVPARELTDRQRPLNALWPRGPVSEASDRLLEQRTAGGRVAVAQSLLELRRPAIGAPDPIVEHALSLVWQGRHDRVERLARNVGVSRRHLHRRFIASVGYSPKMFQRILRFQKLLALGADCSTRLGDVAQCGWIRRSGAHDERSQ
jgi:AraC-like DNA-binding protein